MTYFLIYLAVALFGAAVAATWGFDEIKRKAYVACIFWPLLVFAAFALAVIGVALVMAGQAEAEIGE